MPDIIDAANDLTARLTASAEAQARGKSAPECHPGFDGVSCVECGEDLHPVRLRMGKVRCTDCQDRLERRR